MRNFTQPVVGAMLSILVSDTAAVARKGLNVCTTMSPSASRATSRHDAGNDLSPIKSLPESVPARGARATLLATLIDPSSRTVDFSRTGFPN
jgi:hypothetical protein